MSFVNSPILYDNQLVYYLINDNCRKNLVPLFDCLGNIANYNDYNHFLRKYPNFSSFKYSKVSKYIKNRLKEDEYILIIYNAETKEIQLATKENYQYFFKNYNNTEFDEKYFSYGPVLPILIRKKSIDSEPIEKVKQETENELKENKNQDVGPTSDMDEQHTSDIEPIYKENQIINELFKKYDKTEYQESQSGLNTQLEIEKKTSILNPLWKLFGW